MPDIYPVPCIHSHDGRSLCAACQEEYDIDPSAYDEFGQHPAGIENFRHLEEEIAADAAREAALPPGEPDSNIPF